jgi:hypothetical protein
MVKNKIMSKKVVSLIGMFLVFTLLISVPAMAAQFGGGVESGFGGNYQVIGSSSNPQFTQPQFHLGSGMDPKDYWSDFNKEDCTQRQDMVLMIPPGGCSPSVVRSDLLEEQNVPVFCKVTSVELNPLIDISKIKSIRFKGDYPKGVQSVSYFPARAAVRSGRTLEASPVVDNIGYLVVVLKSTEIEDDMPDYLEGNVTAIIDYDSEGIFGVGTQDFFLTQTNEDEWLRNYRDSGFWQGKGYLRASEINEDGAVISIYQGDAGQKVASVSLKKGETSKSINLGGYYCAAGMKLQLKDVGFPQNTVRLRVDDQDIWVGEGSSFLDGKCRVSKITLNELGGGSVRLTCTGTGSFELRINPVKASFKIGKDALEEKEFEMGTSTSITTKNGQEVYLAYAGRYRGSKYNYQVLIAPKTGIDQFKGISNFAYSRESKWSKKSLPGKIWSVGWFDLIDYIKKPQVDVAAGYKAQEEEIEYYKFLTEELIDNSDYKLGENDFKILIGPGAQWKEYEIVASGKESGESVLTSNPLLKEYYENSINSYKDLSELYPSEKPKNLDNAEPYAAQGLKSAGDLSKLIGLDVDARSYYEQLVETYPDANLANSVQNELMTYASGVSKESQALVPLDDGSHFISLFEVKNPGVNDLGAELMFTVNGKQTNVEWEKDSLQTIKGTEIPIEVIDIKEDSVEIRYASDFKFVNYAANALSRTLIGKTAKWEKETLEINKPTSLTPQITVKLTKTNLNKQVQVEIVPEVRGTRTEADFGFKIGIEKRAIDLSPQRTKKIIENLQETIKKWSDINEKLGNVVKGMKAACFATSAVLTVKNFFKGMSGEAQARNELMTDVWNKNCRKWSGDMAVKDDLGETYKTVDACLLARNDDINRDVAAYEKIIEQQNTEFDRIYEEDLSDSDKTKDGFFTESYDTQAVTDAYREGAFADLNKNKIYTLSDGSKGNISSIVGVKYEKELSVEEMRDMVTYSNLPDSGALGQLKEDKMKEMLFDVKRRLQYSQGQDEIELRIKRDYADKNFGAIPSLGTSLGREVPAVAMNSIGKTDFDFTNSFKEGNKIVSLFVTGSKLETHLESGQTFTTVDDAIEGETVLIELQKTGDKWTYANGIVSGAKEVDPAVSDKIQKYLADEGIGTQFKEVDIGYYRNPYKETAVVKYYERAPYKGLPALVPFDDDNGWYAATDYVVNGFGKPFEDSGRAVNFWVCNVGENGLFEFKQGDDCRYYNVGSPASTLFPGLSQSESSRVVSQAQRALQDASKGYGKKKVSILNRQYGTAIAENGESGRCSDFMSPEECNLMFNLCDPVICPSSRCDFGGAYRVDNVIQSGIVGSLALCLPNFPEVKVPVCLSGVHAGIDGWISVLESGEKCLQESLDTGKNIGICDEVTSVFMCDFFWKQAVPLLEVGVPRLFEAALGQGVRGGGEYMTIQNAYDNTQASIDYFKNDYAVNSFNAFSVRSTEEIGGEVCKSFVGARYPSSANFFDQLTEPDSPEQYSGWFDENVLNTATIPATSHYKVYYHIYAGNDRGAQYTVFLRGSSDGGLIRSTGDYVVDRGYIAKGSQVDEAKDFAAVSGFTKLCINVNGKEDCNFKQVSTSAAANYIRDKYAADQASETDIKTASECVAGKPSLLALAQPNLQAGVEEMAQSELYKRGIVRVCSTNNPGAQVNEKTGDLDSTRSVVDRWKEVGECGDSKIKCWVDLSTVEDVLGQNKLLLNNTLDEIESSYFNKIGGFLTEGESNDVLSKAIEVLGDVGKVLATNQLTSSGIENAYEEILSNLSNVENMGATNNHRAQAIYLKGEIYMRLAERIYWENVLKEKGYARDASGNIVEVSGELKEGVLIRTLAGQYGEYCEYKFSEFNGWVVDEKVGKRYLPTTNPADREETYVPESPDCIQLSAENYLTGISEISKAHSTNLIIDGEKVTADDVDEMELEIHKVLGELKLQGIAEWSIKTIKKNKLLVIVNIENKAIQTSEYKVYLYDAKDKLLDTEPDLGWKNIGSGKDSSINLDSKVPIGEIGDKYTIKIKEQNSGWEDSKVETL